MSVRVITTVFKHSESRLGSRLTLLVLADAAHEDGVTWVSQVTIAERTKLSRREVIRSVQDLETLGELEVRKAQRGQSRINVYRVTLPDVAAPVYENLPFELSTAFTTTVCQYVTSSEGYEVTSSPLRGDIYDTLEAPSPSSLTVSDPSGVTGSLVDDLTALGIKDEMILNDARRFPGLAESWYARSDHPDIENRAAYIVAGMRGQEFARPKHENKADVAAPKSNVVPCDPMKSIAKMIENGALTDALDVESEAHGYKLTGTEIQSLIELLPKQMAA